MQVRVTEVLGFFKQEWYVKWVAKNGLAVCNRIGKASMKVGSRVDEIIKEGSLIVAKKDSAEVNHCVNAFIKWKQVYQPKEILNGVRLYKEVDGVEVTGEPDIYVDGVLVDIKCASKISLDYWLQVNVYRWLEGKTGKVAILRLDKVTASYEYVVKDYDPFLVNVWRGLMNAYVYYKGDTDGDVDVREGDKQEALA